MLRLLITIKDKKMAMPNMKKRKIRPAMALRLSCLFGNSPEFWLNVQHSWDLWDSEQRYGKELSQIQPLNAA
jgi:antitoxin HigA-1